MRHFGYHGPEVLLHAGPQVEVTLRRHSLAPDRSFAVGLRLMVDTGAQRTFISRPRLQELGVAPVRFEEFIGLNGRPEEYPVYLASFEFGVGTTPTAVAPHIVTVDVEAIGMPEPVAECGHQGLIGRDVLSHLVFVYDGPNGAHFMELAGETRRGLERARRQSSQRPSGPAKDKTKRKRKRKKKRSPEHR